MKPFAIASVALFIVACGTSTSEDTAGSHADLKTVQTTGGPTCGGWTCGHAVRPTSDKEIFDIAARNGGAEASNPNVVKLAALECAEIIDSCEPASCFIRTTCGGGGPLQGTDSESVESWLTMHGAPAETISFARRFRAADVECVRSGSTGDVSCSFVGNSGGTSGGTSGTSGSTGSSSGSSGTSGATSGGTSGGPPSGGTSGSTGH
jgi:hypothetical protein